MKADTVCRTLLRAWKSCAVHRNKPSNRGVTPMPDADTLIQRTTSKALTDA